MRAIIVLLLLVSYVYSQNKNPEITKEEIKELVYKLASKEFNGRKPGTEGGYLSGDYIKEQINSDEIEFLFDDGYQYFDITAGIEAGENNKVLLGDKELKLNYDFVPFNISSTDEIEAEAVFVGFGFSIDDDDLKWDDYAGVDVKDKIGIVLRDHPDFETDHTLFEDNASYWKKVINAKDNGAAAVILVSPHSYDIDDNLMKLSAGRTATSAGIPVVQVKRNAIDGLLSDYDVTIAELEEVYKNTKKPYSFGLEGKVKLSTEIIFIKKKARNVVAFLEGNELKDEIVVIGGHYDHLGMGGPGSGSRRPDTSAIHWGADDNGSGTAAIIEIFEKLAANKENLKRSVLYCSFDAEEMGLLGSKYFVENQPFDDKKIVYMANLDMIGRMDTEERKFTIGGTGTAPELPAILDSHKDKYSFNPSYSPGGLGPSDHASFYAKNIPVTFVFGGVHPDYHTPSDLPDKLHYDELTDLTNYLYDIIFDVTNLDSSLTFTEAGPKSREGGRRNFKVSMGIMPDFTGGEIKGLKIDAVMKDRPAQKAGLLKGDIIIEMDSKKVENIYEYMNRLSSLKKGMTIKVKVLRDKEELTFDVTF